MKDQYEAITPDEYILRRILNIKNYYDLSLPIPVQRGAFGPTKKDIDGLSVYREECVTAQEVAEAGPNEAGYYVARIRVQDLIDLGVTVVADPKEGEGELPGHSLIPELSISAKEENRKKYKELTLKLAKLASQDIAHTP